MKGFLAIKYKNYKNKTLIIIIVIIIIIIIFTMYRSLCYLFWDFLN